MRSLKIVAIAATLTFVGAACSSSSDSDSSPSPGGSLTIQQLDSEVAAAVEKQTGAEVTVQCATQSEVNPDYYQCAATTTDGGERAIYQVSVDGDSWSFVDDPPEPGDTGPLGE